MEKKYNPNEYDNAVPCEVCGGLNFADDYGNTDNCTNCGSTNLSMQPEVETTNRSTIHR
ncbi:MAG: hypothetical protein J1F18_07580 [Lachnospiraceae bacterium]|nr:hypothetical protein [Lachnospiraceae bacterium]